MKLHYFETPNGRKACAVAKHLGSPVDYVKVDLGKGQQKSDEFLAVNPNGRIPAIEDGDVKLWESTAIMCYLAKKAGSDLWPSDHRQIEIIQWFNWDTAHFSRHAGAIVWENMIKPMFGLGETNQSTVDEAEIFFIQFATVLNEHLASRSHLVGDKLSLADFSIAGFMPYAEAGKIPLEGFPNIKRWHDAMLELPAWAEPYPA